MKSKFIIHIALLLLSIFQLNAQPKPVKPNAKVKNDPAAEAILKQLKSRYMSLSNFTFDFSAVVNIPESKKDETFSGKYISQGSKYYIKIKDMEMANDGTSYTVVNHENKEIQVSEASSKNASETVFDFIYNYNKLYKYQVKEVLPNNVSLVELVPLQKNSNVFKIDLKIQNKTNSILSVKLHERSGIKINYSINNTSENAKLAANTFTINAANYKGYNLVDLR